MASIIQRNKSYDVIYYTKAAGTKSKQKWETYSTKEVAERRKWEIEKATAFLGIAPKLNLLLELLDEYIRVYGEVRWPYTSYSARVLLIKRYIIPQIGKVRLSKVVEQKTLYVFLKYKVNSKTRLVLKTPKTLIAIRKIFLPKTLIENLLDYKENQKQKNEKILTN